MPQPLPRRRDRLHLLDDQAVQRARTGRRQRPAHLAVQRAHARGGVDHEAVVALAVDVLVQQAGVGGELADDFLEQVLQRHQSLHVAVFVDHERDPPPLSLELQQLLVERGALRHVVRFARPGERHQFVAVELVAHQQPRDLLHVQDADQRLELAVVHRDARVPALADLFDDVVPVVLEVDAVDLAARHHDVVDRDLFQVEDAHQHALVAVRDDGARLGDDGAQFLAAERGAVRPARAVTPSRRSTPLASRLVTQTTGYSTFSRPV